MSLESPIPFYVFLVETPLKDDACNHQKDDQRHQSRHDTKHSLRGAESHIDVLRYSLGSKLLHLTTQRLLLPAVEVN